MAKIQERTQYEITIIIGTYNRPEVLTSLLKQLDAVSKTISFEVLIIDQSDEENYKKNVKNLPKSPDFNLIRQEKPNTCKYLNTGWQKAQAPIVLYLDDDVTITDDTIRAHLDAYQDEHIRGVAGRVINDNEAITTDNRVGKIFFNGAVITKNFTYTKKTFVDFPYGCNMSFRKATLQQLNGFDEHIQPPIYAFNEIDMGVRISKRWPNSLLFEPKALVYHHQYKTGGTRAYEQSIYKKAVSMNFGYFIGKNYTIVENLIFLFRRIPYQIIKEPKEILNIIKGYLYAKK